MDKSYFNSEHLQNVNSENLWYGPHRSVTQNSVIVPVNEIIEIYNLTCNCLIKFFCTYLYNV